MKTETGSIVEVERMNIGRAAPALSWSLVALEKRSGSTPCCVSSSRCAPRSSTAAPTASTCTPDARKAGESEQRLYAVATAARERSRVLVENCPSERTLSRSIDLMLFNRGSNVLIVRLNVGARAASARIARSPVQR